MAEDMRSSGSPASGIESISHRDHTPLQPLPAFQHDPLDQEVHSIRLMEILPDSNDSAIRCRIRHATIDEASYKCLSYTWLPRFPEHDIEVNGAILTVGENLYQFLFAYRNYQREGQRRTAQDYSGHDNEPSPLLCSLWIDAICIDQFNLSERNHQVRQMGHIYKSAQQVLIWLGRIGEDMLRLFLDFDKLTAKRRFKELELLVVRAYIKQMEPCLRDLLQKQLWDLMTLPYWSRIWIAQEILLPEDTSRGFGIVKIFLGPNIVDFNDVYLSVSLTKRGLKYMGIEMETKNGENKMYLAYGGWRENRDRWSLTGANSVFSLPELLEVFQYCKSGDRRDRVFALLSLAKENPQIDVDYSMTDVSLFQHVMERFMDGTALDELLWLGALLIEALEICYSRKPQTVTGSLHESDTTGFQFPGPLRWSVGNPIWTETSLLVLSESEAEVGCDHTRGVMRSVAFIVNDGNDVHILEYAIQESEAGVSVKYGRTYEYVYGRPALVRHCAWYVEFDGHKVDSDHLFAWLGMPSEDVYYCRFNLSDLGRNPSPFEDPPPLKAWKTDIVRQLPVTSRSNQHSTPPRLAPSKRFWLRDNLSTKARVQFDVFPAALDAMGEMAEADYGKVEGFTVPLSRGSLLRFADRKSSWNRTPMTYAETHYGYKSLALAVQEAAAPRNARILPQELFYDSDDSKEYPYRYLDVPEDIYMP
jgi:hypothetical protein